MKSTLHLAHYLFSHIFLSHNLPLIRSLFLSSSSIGMFVIVNGFSSIPIHNDSYGSKHLDPLQRNFNKHNHCGFISFYVNKKGCWR